MSEKYDPLHGLRQIVEASNRRPVEVGLLPAKHRATGREVVLLVTQGADGGIIPVAEMLNPVQALEEYIPSAGDAGAYDETGEVWEVRKPGASPGVRRDADAEVQCDVPVDPDGGDAPTGGGGGQP